MEVPNELHQRRPEAHTGPEARTEGRDQVSRYLEEAAGVLRETARQYKSFDHQIQVARQFAELAAIESGQLPASIVDLVLNQITGGTQ